MPRLEAYHHVAELPWWLRTITGCSMMGTAVALRHRKEMTFNSAVLTFVGLVSLPTEDTIAGIVDNVFEQPVRTIGALIAMIAMLWLIPFVIGLMAGTPTEKDSLLHPHSHESNALLNNTQDTGYVVTTVAALSVAMLNVVPHSVTNIMMGLVMMPMAVSATRLGAAIRGPDSDLNIKDIMSRALTCLYGVLLMIVLLVIRRSCSLKTTIKS
jgi:hypothetical protein